MAVRTITRAEYNDKRPHQYAGTITRDEESAQLWRELNPDWDGKHWALGGDTTGVYLAPVNIRG